MSDSSLPPARRGTYERLKRVIDIVGAMIGLVITAPAMAVIAVLIRLDTPGPAIFRQVRVGRKEQPFSIYKFRTMHTGCDERVHRDYVRRLLSDDVPPNGGKEGVYKLTGDPRVTRVGSKLRATSLDELPQLLNVLRGEMSLVGPRPALPYELELFSERHRMRAEVKPGLTGLWQVSGRSELTMRQALDLDVDYVHRRGILLDLKILAQTATAVLGGNAR